MPPGYKENLNIILMRDNGPRRSFKLRSNHYYALIAFFACLPFLCALLGLQCWALWKENGNLRENLANFESECQTAQATAARLENLEELLKETNMPGREIVLRRIAGTGKKAAEPRHEDAAAPDTLEHMEAGPGHEDFPALDTGRVRVGNVQARAMRGHSLRIALDLRNPDNEAMLSGEVDATLVTAAGEKLPLRFDRADMGAFRINRFKRAVMISRVPADASLINAEVIVEVRDQAGQPVYRNIFPVQR